MAKANADASALLDKHAAAPAVADKFASQNRLDAKSQSSLASVVNGERLEQFLHSCNARERVRVQSLCGFGAMAMFYAIPSCPELQVLPRFMPIIIAFVLGSPFPLQQPPTCICKRGTVLDDDGVHLMSCAANGRIQTHNDVQLVLAELAREASHSVTETHNLAYVHPNSASKPDLNIHTRLRHGRDNYVDVTLPYPLSQSHMSKNSEPLAAAASAAAAKVEKHGAAVAEFNGRFWPFAVEAFGSFGVEARELFDKLVDEIPREEFVAPNWAALSPRAYWKQAFSVALYAGHAKSMLILLKKALNNRPLAKL